MTTPSDEINSLRMEIVALAQEKRDAQRYINTLDWKVSLLRLSLESLLKERKQ